MMLKLDLHSRHDVWIDGNESTYKKVHNVLCIGPCEVDM